MAKSNEKNSSENGDVSEVNSQNLDISQLIKIKEGSAEIYSFRPEDSSKTGKALSKNMPVFYNPIQEINRSISLLVFKIFFRDFSEKKRGTSDTTLKFCDTMAASGVRSIRMSQFIDLPANYILNDLNPLALKLIEKNLELNDLKGDQFELAHYDARFLLHKLANEGNFQTIIDIDPFGTPNILIEPAIKALSVGGMLGVTATDTAVLFGVRYKACLRKYNVRPLRSTFLKEVGLRILLYFIANRAHPHNYGIEPIISISTDHYIRVFVIIHKGNKVISKNFNDIGYMLWCKKCDWRETIEYDKRKIRENCPNCGDLIEYGGPMWIGKIHLSEFVEKIKTLLEKSDLDDIPSKELLMKTINTIKTESGLPAGYYQLHKICNKLKQPVPKMEAIIQYIQNKGKLVSRTHIEPLAIKTDMNIEEIHIMLKELNRQQ